jgi:hypothetical protein
MPSRLDQFLAGENPDDIAFYLSETFADDHEALADNGELVEDGVLVVVHGEQGRQAFRMAVGLDPMAFSREAMATGSRIDRDLAGGDCPHADEVDDDHHVEFVFAFAETENEEVGGIYAEGDVVHAYARCACGANYSDRWLADGD